MKDVYRVIGLMSGTSLDGLDIAYCKFQKMPDRWQFELEQTKHVSYDDDRVLQLKNAVELPPIDLLELNVTYGRWLGNQVKQFVTDNNLTVDFVASHGHTIFHQPEIGFTYQIGAGADLAQYSGLTVVSDFRSLDVTMGGQGAPLVPIGDQQLFSEYDFCLNLGGIANISFTARGGREAYDVSPANMLLNYLAGQKGKAYDEGGKMASRGSVDQELLNKLNTLEFYQQPYPKSLGYEWFIDKVQPIVDASSSSVEDKMATSVAHIAQMISEAVISALDQGEAKLLVTGGGAKNLVFIKQLKAALGSSVEVIVPDEALIDYKEAIIFAFMGVLKMRNEANCLSSVTGASQDVSGGVIFQPV